MNNVGKCESGKWSQYKYLPAPERVRVYRKSTLKAYKKKALLPTVTSRPFRDHPTLLIVPSSTIATYVSDEADSSTPQRLLT